MAKKKQKEEVVIAYKGFNNDLQCTGGDTPFQYEIGKTYEHEGKVVRCAAGGFHSCEFPLDVFGYYAPGDSRYAIVHASGDIDRDDSDTKIASAKITIETEIRIPELVRRGVYWIMARVENTKVESNTGDRSAATNTGYRSAATNTGDQSAATNTGDQSAATNTGDRSAATNTGYQSAATVEGRHSVAISCGIEGTAKANAGSAIVLCYRDTDAGGDEYGRIVHIRAAIAGKDGIKPDTYYKLNADGEFEEAA